MTRNELDDLFIAALARELRDDDRLLVGANQPDVVLAAHLARQFWAPGLKLWASGGIELDQPVDMARVGRRAFDPIAVEGRSSFFWQARAFDEMGRRPHVCFAGGIQVDARGNANLAGIRKGDAWKLRGPGSAGLPSLTTWAKRFFILVPDHQPRALVERCSQISVLGDPVARAELGLNPDALVAIITPLARFEPTDDGVVLTEITHEFTLDEVAVRTGFAVRSISTPRRRVPLSEEERSGISKLRAATNANSSLGRHD